MLVVYHDHFVFELQHAIIIPLLYVL